MYFNYEYPKEGSSSDLISSNSSFKDSAGFFSGKGKYIRITEGHISKKG
jgi:hypothetical protein